VVRTWTVARESSRGSPRNGPRGGGHQGVVRTGSTEFSTPGDDPHSTSGRTAGPKAGGGAAGAGAAGQPAPQIRLLFAGHHLNTRGRQANRKLCSSPRRPATYCGSNRPPTITPRRRDTASQAGRIEAGKTRQRAGPRPCNGGEVDRCSCRGRRGGPTSRRRQCRALPVLEPPRDAVVSPYFLGAVLAIGPRSGSQIPTEPASSRNRPTIADGRRATTRRDRAIPTQPAVEHYPW
jgi:hypothetical protein